VYALDATTIDLWLSMFPWTEFRSTNAAVKLLPEPGAFYIMDRGYLDFARLYVLDQAGSFFVTRAKSNMNARRPYSTSENAVETQIWIAVAVYVELNVKASLHTLLQALPCPILHCVAVELRIALQIEGIPSGPVR
jgi:hypothetical protein